MKTAPAIIRKSLLTFLLAAIIGALALNACAQEPPTQIHIPVTYYDFHSDGSNPEFQPEDPAEVIEGVKLNTVADTLDADFKPVVGAKPYMNLNVGKWYRPWEPGDFKHPVYSGDGYTTSTMQQADHDTAFKNIVIQDSLTLRSGPNGIYRYRAVLFDPLGERGFGIESQRYHLSFTMEMAFEFKYKKGEELLIIADDDCWIFIDNKLVLDIGGMHVATVKELNLADINNPPLVEDQTYTMRIFYAERCVVSGVFTMEFNGFYPDEITNPTEIGGSITSAVPLQPLLLKAVAFNGAITFFNPFVETSVVKLFSCNGAIDKVMRVTGKGTHTIVPALARVPRLMSISSPQGTIAGNILIR